MNKLMFSCKEDCMERANQTDRREVKETRLFSNHVFKTIMLQKCLSLIVLLHIAISVSPFLHINYSWHKIFHWSTSQLSLFVLPSVHPSAFLSIRLSVKLYFSYFLGSGPERDTGNFRSFVCSFVRPSIPPLPSSGLSGLKLGTETSNLASLASNPASQASNPDSQASNPASQASNPASQVSNPASQVSNPASQVSSLASQFSNPNSQASDWLSQALHQPS